MPEELIYEITSVERVDRIVDALTRDDFHVYPAPSPEVGKVRVHVDAADEQREAVEGVVARHDLAAVAIG